MKDKQERKVIKINLMKFLILLTIIIALCVYLGINYKKYKSGEENIYSKVINLIKGTPEIQQEEKLKYSNEEIKKIFEEAAKLHVNTITAPSEYIVKEYGEIISGERDYENLEYVKTNILYDEFVEKYEEFFTEGALEEIKEIKTKNNEGILYVKDAGMNIYDIINVSIKHLETTEQGTEKYNGKYKLIDSQNVYDLEFSYNFEVKDSKDSKGNVVPKICYYKEEFIENLEQSVQDYEEYEKQNNE